MTLRLYTMLWSRSTRHITGPRIALVVLQYYLTRSPTSSLPTLVFVSGMVRTLACGGWVYITSSDDHDAHDFLMITYMGAYIPIC